MSNYARYRNWHMWIGLVLLLPLTAMAITGFLWNHEKALGIKAAEQKNRIAKGQVSAPSSAMGHSKMVAEPGAWSSHSNAIDAALAEARRQWGHEMELERIELKHEPEYGLVVKVKISEESDVRPYEIVWGAESSRVLERKGDPQSGTDWAKIVHDLHTGKIFSARYGYFWSDGSALALLALGTTGVVLYCIPMLKKRNKQKKAPQQAMVRKTAGELNQGALVGTTALANSVAAGE